jgi:hypothetical protein
MQIGFSQRIQLQWLECTPALAVAGQTPKEIKRSVEEILRDHLSVGGTAQRGNREKAITILLKTWVTVPRDLKPLRDEGLDHLHRLPFDDHLGVHWGMAMAAYPFFGLVAQTVGRLLRLQGSAAAAQVQRRVREQLGERETVARATRRTLRCFIDWGVLVETADKGVYHGAPLRPVRDRCLAAWIIEALLLSNSSDAVPLHGLAQAPALFPFAIEPLRSIELSCNSRLEVFRQGLDQDMVLLRDGV